MNTAKRDAVVAKLAKAIFDTDKITAIYLASGLDQQGKIYWKQPAQSLWTDILNLHWVDFEILVDALKKSDHAAQANEVRAIFDGEGDGSAQGEAHSIRELASAHLSRRADRAIRALLCDREAQWDAFSVATKLPPLAIYLLGGPKERGHSYFLNRIRAKADGSLPGAPDDGSLPRAPAIDALVIDVDPAGLERPTTLDHAVAGLSDALALALGRGVDEAHVVGLLSDLVAQGNVFLMHKMVSLADDPEPWLTVYVSAVIPQLYEAISAASPKTRGPRAGTLVPVIPIEWDGGAAYSLLVERLRARAPKTPIIAPSSLDAIDRTDVEMLLYKMTRGLDVPALAKRIARPDASIHDLFERLQDEMRRIPEENWS